MLQQGRASLPPCRPPHSQGGGGEPHYTRTQTENILVKETILVDLTQPIAKHEIDTIIDELLQQIIPGDSENIIRHSSVKYQQHLCCK